MAVGIALLIKIAENLAAWEQYLQSWPSPVHRGRPRPDGTIENLGRVQDDVHPRLSGPAAVRAGVLLREQFGDLDRARDVLTRLTAILDALDQPESVSPDTEQPSPTPDARRRQKPQKE